MAEPTSALRRQSSPASYVTPKPRKTPAERQATFRRRQAERLAALEADNARLRAAIEDYLLWRPGERGHAAAHRKLKESLDA